MDDELLTIYRCSAYRVRLRSGGAATLRVDEPLPVALRSLAGDRDWGFFTAWNPGSTRLPPAVNRQAQRRLLAELRADPALDLHPGRGEGRDRWCEPSLWIVGIAPRALERLGARYGQNGWLFGHGAGVVTLQLR